MTDDSPEDDYPPMICPATGMYCANWGEPSCEDFGCCIQAGLPPLPMGEDQETP